MKTKIRFKLVNANLSYQQKKNHLRKLSGFESYS